MPSSSSSPSPTTTPAAPGAGRTRNAQAQASLRLRRKAYIKSLEDTVSSLEQCLGLHLSCSSSPSPSEVEEVRGRGSEVEELRKENKKFKRMLVEANLANANAVASGSTPDSGRKGKKKVNGARKGMEEENGEGWSKTSSIMAKKRKLSSVQAFAAELVAESIATTTSTINATVHNFGNNFIGLPSVPVKRQRWTTREISMHSHLPAPQTPPSYPILNLIPEVQEKHFYSTQDGFLNQPATQHDLQPSTYAAVAQRTTEETRMDLSSTQAACSIPQPPHYPIEQTGLNSSASIRLRKLPNRNTKAKQ
ncbi:uncharacterized protein UHOD_20025 [Ustilago sp. UG-2017b]|nr:uncharacterized protein UHOD_20025 [Ustilago sp. UG-2017b]